ncbi:CLUMA_CG015475, isoform A [Clunio marinus]|uniref:CLUMA_CG015475, isoform A n=1 Tax=Clunio marinus TaxID=568069 RepID=A0A1J1IQR1_9DIPT|nr:CLUMA_CG015475, isoform A [Clunio marinus]
MCDNNHYDDLAFFENQACSFIFAGIEMKNLDLKDLELKTFYLHFQMKTIRWNIPDIFSITLNTSQSIQKCCRIYLLTYLITYSHQQDVDKSIKNDLHTNNSGKFLRVLNNGKDEM